MGPVTKGVLCFLAAVMATIAAASLAFNATAYTGSQPVNLPWVQTKLEFVAWNNERWTAWIRDDTFEQVPENTAQWSRHSNASLAFIDWKGEAWQAKIDGDEFLLAHRGDWNATTERAASIRYRDWEGNNQLRTVIQLRR